MPVGGSLSATALVHSSGAKSRFANIFAGINRCDWVAEGIVKALEAHPMRVPLVVRLAGTNVEEGRKILARSPTPIIRATTLSEAAERAVTAWRNANTVAMSAKLEVAS